MLNEMEKRALEMLLAGPDDRLAILRSQLNGATVDRREMSGAGFFRSGAAGQPSLHGSCESG